MPSKTKLLCSTSKNKYNKKAAHVSLLSVFSSIIVSSPVLKKWRHFDLKNWDTGDSILRVKLTLNIESIWLKCFPIIRNYSELFPLVTQLFRSKWLHIFFQCVPGNSLLGGIVGCQHLVSIIFIRYLFNILINSTISFRVLVLNPFSIFFQICLL